MKTPLLAFLFLFFTTCGALAQQHVYLKKNSNGHLKKNKPKTVLSLKVTDSTWNVGRIVSAQDSTLKVVTFHKYEAADTVFVPISSVRLITNDLMNGNALAETAGWILIGAAFAVVMVPIAWAADGSDAAVEGLGMVGVLVGTSAVMLSPYLIKKKYDLKKEMDISCQIVLTSLS